jgi:hypothetical protein
MIFQKSDRGNSNEIGNILGIHILEFLPEIQDSNIKLCIHTERFEIKHQLFCVCVRHGNILQFYFQKKKNAIFRKISAKLHAKLG